MESCIELQNALLDTRTVEEFLHELTLIAVRQVAEGSSCGMTMRPNGRPATVACSDPVAAQVDEVQYRLDDGPCLRAMRVGEVVAITDTAEQTRWPEFEAAAAAVGIRSCLALPLSTGSAGALNLYARGVSAFGETERRRAEEFADTASGALALAQRLGSYASLNEQLRASLASRSVIDQALGIIMVRGAVAARPGPGDGGQRCTQARAFELLRTASQNSNTKLRDLASALVFSVTGEPVQQAPPFDEPSASSRV
jgi:GAF domain-containing protein